MHIFNLKNSIFSLVNRTQIILWYLHWFLQVLRLSTLQTGCPRRLVVSPLHPDIGLNEVSDQILIESTM